MGKKAPASPDYAALAKQQGTDNIEVARLEAMMNRVNQVTPYGNRTWTNDPNNPDSWTVTDTMSPNEEFKYNQQSDIENRLLSDTWSMGLPALEDALRNGNFEAPGDIQTGWDPEYAPDQRFQTESGMYEAPWIQESLDYSAAPWLQTALDFSSAAPIPKGDAETRKRVEDSVYQAGARWLDPQFQKQQNQLDTKLSNQGIFVGSDAHKDSQNELDTARTQAYGDLRDRAIQMGGDQMAQLFGLGMQEHQTGVQDLTTKGSFANAARGQAISEITQQGQFANQARGQLISELMQDMQARNAAIGMQGNMASQQQQANNTGLQQWLQQAAASKTLPINIITALMSGTQVNNPQFQAFNNQTQVQPPPTFQAGVAQGQADLNRYNAQQAATGQWLNFAGSLGAGYLAGRKP